jgi:hypothetical protein
MCRSLTSSSHDFNLKPELLPRRRVRSLNFPERLGHGGLDGVRSIAAQLLIHRLQAVD